MALALSALSALSLLSGCLTADLVGFGCARNPELPYCAKAEGAATVRERRAEVSEHDKIACRELGSEYKEKCSGSRHEEAEFCQAFENICFKAHKSEAQPVVGRARVQSELETFDEEGKEDDRIFAKEKTTTSEPEPIPITAPTASKTKKKRINFTKFCKDFKNRYLYICPDPFRFGQKAVLFCPIYSEHCHVPLPEKPVLPERKSGRKGGSVARLCRSYRNFAETYCNNALLLSQPRYREGCEKYWRFCLRRSG